MGALDWHSAGVPCQPVTLNVSCDPMLHNWLYNKVKTTRVVPQGQLIEMLELYDGKLSYTVPTLPGCISQGKTRAEALKNIQEAIEVYIESLKTHNEPIPPSIDEEIVEVAVWVRFHEYQDVR